MFGLNELLNSLNCNNVFRSYLSNLFILNEINQIIQDVEDGKKQEEDLNIAIDSIIKSVGMLIPPNLLQKGATIDQDNFIKVVTDVKHSSIKNLIERRKN
jgi:hypothetical protein